MDVVVTLTGRDLLVATRVQPAHRRAEGGDERSDAECARHPRRDQHVQEQVRVSRRRRYGDVTLVVSTAAAFDRPALSFKFNDIM